MQRNEQEILASKMEAVCGPAARYSDHAVGEVIVYRVGTEVRSGPVLFIQAPGQIGSSHTPLTYLVDSGHGWPDLVWQSDIIEPPLWVPPAA